MLRKTVTGLLLSSSLLFSNDLLTGDTKLSCEAILCLSTGSRPNECNASIQKYFSIKAKKPQDTIKARQNFLKLCPVGDDAEKDEKFTDLRDNVLPNTDPRQCTANYLNQQIESKRANSYNNENFYLSNRQKVYRVNPTIPSQCNKLFNHSYTDLKRPIYHCSGEFYNSLEWEMSSKLQQISYSEYRNLPSGSKHQIDYSDGESSYTIYYKKIPFSKTCWKDN